MLERMAEEFLGSSSESSVELSVDSSSASSSASISTGSNQRPHRSRRHPSGPRDASQVTDADYRNIPPR